MMAASDKAESRLLVLLAEPHVLFFFQGFSTAHELSCVQTFTACLHQQQLARTLIVKVPSFGVKHADAVICSQAQQRVASDLDC